MLCLAASMPDGFDAFDTNWRVAQEIAAEFGRRMDPSVLRLVGQMHIAESRDQARANARFGFLKWLRLFRQDHPGALCRSRRAQPDRPAGRDRLHRVRHAR
jgi:limonene 1,2-monooxygenase